MNTALKVDVDAFFPEGQKSPTAKPGNISDFPSTVRLQDIVLTMLLKGNTYAQIAHDVNRKEEDVVKIARSEWAQQEMERRASALPEEEQMDSLRRLIRITGFDAVRKIGELIDCESKGIAIQACRIALQYSLPLPNAKQKDESGPEKLPKNSDAIREELIRITAEIERRKNPNSHQE